MFLFNHCLASGLDLALVSIPFTSCRWAVTRCRETGNLDFANDRAKAGFLVPNLLVYFVDGRIENIKTGIP